MSIKVNLEKLTDALSQLESYSNSFNVSQDSDEMFNHERTIGAKKFKKKKIRKSMAKKSKRNNRKK